MIAVRIASGHISASVNFQKIIKKTIKPPGPKKLSQKAQIRDISIMAGTSQPTPQTLIPM